VFVLAREIVLTHHERWDGTGYPRGLAAEAIPVSGCIVAAADVFDALTHERPYKATFTVTEALAEMNAERGRHFHPAALDALQRVLRDSGPIA
jgi:putative two-component system response regulator